MGDGVGEDDVDEALEMDSEEEVDIVPLCSFTREDAPFLTLGAGDGDGEGRDEVVDGEGEGAKPIEMQVQFSGGVSTRTW